MKNKILRLLIIVLTIQIIFNFICNEVEILKDISSVKAADANYLEPDDKFIDKEIIITAGTSYTIKTNTNLGITWGVEDNTIVSSPQSSGRFSSYKAGTTTIRATIQGETYAIPVTVIPRLVTNSNYRTLDMLIDSDSDTTVYYNYSYGEDFTEVNNGTRIVLQMPRKKPIGYANFFAVPSEGKALSYMSGWYAPIVEETEEEVRNNGGPYLFSTAQTDNTTATNRASGVSRAYSMGAEGMFGYISSSDASGTLKIRSEKLPEITQDVYSINGNRYQTGDIAHPGDTVVFALELSKEQYEYLVNYEGTLESNLTGAEFIGTSPNGTGTDESQSISINTSNQYSSTYYIKYIIPSNASGEITNTVTFNYKSYGDPSTTDVVGKVDSTASYKKNRQMSAIAKITIGPETEIRKSYITIKNKILGNMREPEKYFKFLVNINWTQGDTYRIFGQDSTITYNEQQINTSNTYTVGSTNYVYLKSNQTITIGVLSDGETFEIPEGVTYSVTEQDAEDYLTTIEGIQGETKSTGNLTIARTNNTVEFTNSKDAAALTGINFEFISYYIVIFASSVILAFYICFKNHIKKK